MRPLCVLALALALAGAGFAGEKERLTFTAKPAGSYPARDAHDGVTIAAEPFDTAEETKEVFGKHDPLSAGFLPILVVIENKSDKTLKLEDVSIRFITRDRQNIEPTPADLVAARVTGKPSYPTNPVPSPIPKISRMPKNAKSIEVMVHAFIAPIVSPHSSAAGFFYFETGKRREWLTGSSLYLTQLVWANNSQPLLYFEIDLNKALNKAANERK